MYGQVYFCNHPVYSDCTLFKIADKGLAIIQQRYNNNTKTTWWGSIDNWLADSIYLNDHFKEVFDLYSSYSANGLYPTVTVRHIMWRLRMKPLKKERWETIFDRTEI